MKPLGDEVIDQSAHFIAAALVVIIALFLPSPFNGVFFGLALGLVREFTEKKPITTLGSIRDLLFWSLGGLFGSMIHDLIIWS